LQTCWGWSLGNANSLRAWLSGVFTRSGDVVYALLCGGTKRGQKKDIAKAKELALLLKET